MSTALRTRRRPKLKVVSCDMPPVRHPVGLWFGDRRPDDVQAVVGELITFAEFDAMRPDQRPKVGWGCVVPGVGFLFARFVVSPPECKGSNERERIESEIEDIQDAQRAEWELRYE